MRHLTPKNLAIIILVVAAGLIIFATLQKMVVANVLRG